MEHKFANERPSMSSIDLAGTILAARTRPAASATQGPAQQVRAVHRSKSGRSYPLLVIHDRRGQSRMMIYVRFTTEKADK
jgi:hypothetical protein